MNKNMSKEQRFLYIIYAKPKSEQDSPLFQFQMRVMKTATLESFKLIYTVESEPLNEILHVLIADLPFSTNQLTIEIYCNAFSSSTIQKFTILDPTTDYFSFKIISLKQSIVNKELDAYLAYYSYLRGKELLLKSQIRTFLLSQAIQQLDKQSKGYFEFFLMILGHCYNLPCKDLFNSLLSNFSLERAHMTGEFTLSIPKMLMSFLNNKKRKYIDIPESSFTNNFYLFFLFFKLNYERDDFYPYITLSDVQLKLLSLLYINKSFFQQLTSEEVLAFLQYYLKQEAKLQIEGFRVVLHIAKDIGVLCEVFSDKNASAIGLSKLSFELELNYTPIAFTIEELQLIRKLCLLGHRYNISIDLPSLLVTYCKQFRISEDLQSVLYLNQFSIDLLRDYPSPLLESVVNSKQILNIYISIAKDSIMKGKTTDNKEIISYLNANAISLPNQSTTFNDDTMRIIRKINIDQLDIEAFQSLKSHHLLCLIESIGNWPQMMKIKELVSSPSFCLGTDLIEKLTKRFHDIIRFNKPEQAVFNDYLLFLLEKNQSNAQMELYLEVNRKHRFNLICPLCIKLIQRKKMNEMTQASFIRDVIRFSSNDISLFWNTVEALTQEPRFVSRLYCDLQSFIITKQDILSIDKGMTSFTLYANTVKLEFAFDLMKTNYFSMCNKVIGDFIKSIRKQSILIGDIIGLQALKDKQHLQERIQLLLLYQNTEYDEIMNKIEYYLSTYNALHSQVNNLERYYDFFERTNPITLEINKFNAFFRVNTSFSELDKNFNKINAFQQKEEEIKQYLFYLPSRVFLTIFNGIDLNDNIVKRNKSVFRFDLLKRLFDQGVLELDAQLLKNLLSSFDTKEDLREELKVIISILKINDKSEAQCEAIIEETYLLKNKDLIESTLAHILFLIDVTSSEKTELYNQLTSYQFNQPRSTSQLQKLKFTLLLYKEIGLSLEEAGSQLFFSIASLINRQKKLLPFMWKLSIGIIEELMEFIDVFNANAILKREHIFELESLFMWTTYIKEACNKSDRDFIHFIFHSLQEEGFKKVKEQMASIVQVFDAIEDLFNNQADKQYYLSEKMKQLCLKSSLVIAYQENKGRYIPVFSYVNQETNKEQVVSFDDAIELKERALLQIKTDNNHKKTRNVLNESYEKFPLIVNKTSSLVMYLNKLIDKGYTLSGDVSFDIENFEVKLKESIGVSLDKKLKEIKTLYNELTKNQMKAYCNYYLLTFVNGKLYKNIANQCNHKDYFAFLSNNNIKKYPEPIDIVSNHGANHWEIIKKINEYLSKALEINNLTLKNIFKKNIITNKAAIKPGLLKLLIGSNEIEKDLISLYLYACNAFPLPSTVLYCSQETTVEELSAFMYRAIKCPFNVLFCIVKSEELDLERAEVIVSHIEELVIPYSDAMISTLLFTYSSKASKLASIKALTSIVDIGKCSIEEIADLERNVQVIASDSPGVGKTKAIQQESDPHFNYIFFPLGGDFTKEDLVFRLKQLDLSSKQDVFFHLVLSETKHFEEVKEFLFALLIQKCYIHCDMIFYFGAKMHIRVELPFGLVDYCDRYPILRLYRKKVISINSLPPLIISTQLISDIQVVVNYLENMDQLSKNNIDIGINPEVSTGLKAKVYDQAECIACIRKHLSIERPNYYQINSFIKSLASQFTLVAKNVMLEYEALYSTAVNKKQPNLPKVRLLFIKMIKEVTNHFTKGAYADMLQSLKGNFKSQEYILDESEANEETLKHYEEISSTPFHKLPSSLLFFHKDLSSYSIIYNHSDPLEDIELLRQYWDIDSPPPGYFNWFNAGFTKKLIEYQSLKAYEFLPEIKKVFNMKNPITKASKSGLSASQISTGASLSIEEMLEHYIFTYDNFIKMLLVILKQRSHLPIILIGETGCGKTSLIKRIADLSFSSMQTLNIHAGVSDGDIIAFMKQGVLPLTQAQEKEVVVFFDELNTCNSMGLIKEMMCDRTMQGEQLPLNLSFIGACNPYRKRTQRNEMKEHNGLVVTSEVSNVLEYSVNPLPFSLLNFVLNFGLLAQTDEKEYINSFVQKMLLSKVDNSSFEFDKQEKLKETCNKAIAFSHNFIRTQLGITSVSLREMRRIELLFNWFYNYLQFKSKLIEGESCMSVARNYQLQTEALILSLFICYYVRLTAKPVKEAFIKGVQELLACDFLSVINREEKELIRRIALPSGIALTDTLLLNIFIAFVCINTRLPLIICGKPGCSKSLSINLLYSTMKGNQSADAFFRSYPKLYMNLYQGSLTSTSKGVLTVFNKARELLQAQKKVKSIQKIISMIYFDEMGLAEKSKNNPLKVLHSQLEYDDNEEKVAFIGISNWELDAAKMNRCVFLANAEPDETDLIVTANSIYDSYGIQKFFAQSQMLTDLSKAYFEYKTSLKQKYGKGSTNIVEFHGLRDFYHLIRVFSKKMKRMITSTSDALTRIAEEAIEKNFGGLIGSVKDFKSIFIRYCSSTIRLEHYSVRQWIHENLEDSTSRYLLLISSSLQSIHLLNLIIKKATEQTMLFYVGSKFSRDQHKELYSAKIINSILMTLERGDLIVLKDLECVYPSLYDLFNQNFHASNSNSEKKYCRIALGFTNNSHSEVNDNFKCIILIDPEELKRQDPPFLNRFEKHIFSIQSMSRKADKELFKSMETMIKDIVALSEVKLRFNLISQLINCVLEEIQGIVFLSLNDARAKKGEVKESELIHAVLMRIVPTFSQDLIFFLHQSGFRGKYSEKLKEMLSIYKHSEHRSLTSLIASINTNKQLTSRMIVYTFTNIHEKIANALNVSIYSFLLRKASSEKEFDSLLHSFYDEGLNYTVCIIQLEANERIHINHLMYLIERYEKENSIKAVKPIVITIHLERLFNPVKSLKAQANEGNCYISHLSQCTQLFIDDLNGRHSNIDVTEVITYSNRQLFLCKELFNLESAFREYIYPTYTKLKLTFINGEQKQYITDQLNNLLNSQTYQSQLFEAILIGISERKSIIATIFEKEYSGDCKHADFIFILKQEMKDLFSDFLLKTIFKCEKDNVLRPMTSAAIPSNDYALLWKEYLLSINYGSLNINSRQNGTEIRIVNRLKVPCSKVLFDYVLVQVKDVKEAYFNNEDRLRGQIEDKDVDAQKELYVKGEHKILMNLYQEISAKNTYYRLLENEYQGNRLARKTMDRLFRDYCKLFIGNNKNDKTQSNVKLLKLLTKERFKHCTDANPFIQLVRNILWLEANSSIVLDLLQIYIQLNEFNPKLFHTVSAIISSNSIKYEISKRNPSYELQVNEAFYLLLESLIKSIVDNINYITSLPNDLFHSYLIAVKTVIGLTSKVEFTAHIFSQQKTVLCALTDLNDCLVTDTSQQHLAALLAFQAEEKELVGKAEYAKLLCGVLDKEISYFKQIVKAEAYSQYIISFLKEKYINHFNEDYRLHLIKATMRDDQLIRLSYPLLKLFIDIDIEEKENIANALICLPIYSVLLQAFLRNSPLLEQLLLFYFETQINNLFIQSRIEEGQKDNWFTSSVRYIQRCFNEGDEANMVFLLSIGYVKVYLKHFAESKAAMTAEKVNSFFFDKIQVPLLENMLKIYLMKLINNQLGNYSEFVEKMKKTFGWANSLELQSTNGYCFDYLLFDTDITLPNAKLSQLYFNMFEKDYKDYSHQELFKEIEYDSLIVYDLIANQLLFKVYSNEMKQDPAFYLAFSKVIFTLLQGLEISQCSKSLIQLLLNHQSSQLFSNEIFAEPHDEIEMQCYCLKLCLICSYTPSTSFYQQLLSANLLQVLSENFIPGAAPNESPRVNSYPSIEAYLLEKNHPDYGAYICSCGMNYEIAPCGLPSQISICPNCKEQIGGTKHVLVDRNNHFRIYRDEGQKANVEKRSGFFNLIGGYKPMRSMLLEEFRKVVFNEMNEDKKGMIVVSYLYFIKQELKVRGMNQIAYRLLSLIVYSAIYFGVMLGFIPAEEQKKLLIGSKSCLELMKHNWRILSEELKKNGINQVQLFLSIISRPLLEEMKKCSNLHLADNRKLFELKVDQLCLDTISKYDQAKEKLLKLNNDLLAYDPMSLKSIIEEKTPLAYFNPKEYPYMPYLMLNTLPSPKHLEASLQKEEGYKQKYPILTSYFNQKDNATKLKAISSLNPFCNYMINRFSYELSRDEAKAIKLKAVLLDDNTQTLFNDFVNGWRIIGNEATKYQCRPEMEIKAFFSAEDSISHCLNDDGELGYGIYIASAYSKLIQYQNGIIQSIIEANKQNGFAHFFVDSLSKKMSIQDAKKDDIFSFEISSKDYASFEDLIASFSKKGFSESSHCSLEYDLNSIEEEMAKILLPGKKLFSESLRFVTYAFEAYHNDKSTVIDNFLKKYPSIAMSNQQKQSLYDYTGNGSLNIEKMLNSLQLMIFYLQSEPAMPKLSVSSAMKEIPSYVNLSEEFKAFFNANASLLIENLIEILEEIETKCFNVICNNVNTDYKAPLDPIAFLSLRERLNRKNGLIQKEILLKALIKFIARFLSGKRSDSEFKDTESIVSYLSQKSELWPTELYNNEAFEESIFTLFSKGEVLVANSVPFAFELRTLCDDRLAK